MTKSSFNEETVKNFTNEMDKRFNQFSEELSKSVFAVVEIAKSAYIQEETAALAESRFDVNDRETELLKEAKDKLYTELTKDGATENKANLKQIINAENKIFDDFIKKYQSDPNFNIEQATKDRNTQIGRLNKTFKLHFPQHDTPAQRQKDIEKQAQDNSTNQITDNKLSQDNAEISSAKEDPQQKMQDIKNKIYILAQGKYNYTDKEVQKDADESIKELLNDYNSFQQVAQNPNDKQDQGLQKNSTAYKFLMNKSEDTIARMINAKSYKEKEANDFAEFDAENFLKNAPPEVGLKILNIQNKIEQRKIDRATTAGAVKIIIKDVVDKFFNAVSSNGAKNTDLDNLRSAMLQESTRNNNVRTPTPEYRPLTIQPELNKDIKELQNKIDKFINKPSDQPVKDMDYAKDLKRPTPPSKKKLEGRAP